MWDDEDMSDVIADDAILHRVKTLTRQTVDFESINYVAGRDISATIQPAQQEVLESLQIDHSLDYIQVHSLDEISVGEFIEYRGADYKIIKTGNYVEFGFTDGVAEIVRGERLIEN